MSLERPSSRSRHTPEDSERLDSLPLAHQQDGGQTTAEDEATHQEAITFIERHRDLFEHRLRGGVEFKPAPPGLNTFAYDLEHDTVYIHSRFYTSKGFSEEKTVFATMHELEHFKEKLALLKEKGGAKVFERYLARLEKSKAYSLMDNCLADTHENEAVVTSTNESFADIERALYTEDLFPRTDMTDRPRHIQFCEAFLREARVPGETCHVAPEVRAALNRVKGITTKNGTRLADIIAHPDTPMSTRLRLQDRLIWPQVEALLEEDMNDAEQKKQTENDEQKGGKPDASKGEESKPDPNKQFGDAYAEAEKRNPHAVPIKDLKKVFKEWKEKNSDPLDRADAEYAKQLGVKKEDLQHYRAIANELNNTLNPETNQSAIDDLRQLIERIIAHREKERQAPRYPTEEGDILADPAELVSQVKAGNWEPKAWETQDLRLEKGRRFGKVEITLVGDRSGSMKYDGKWQEQQKAAVLLMEVLKEFGDRLREEATRIEKPLSVASEIYTFQDSSEDTRPMKPLSEEIPEKDRIRIASALSQCPGNSTTDFVPLETIARQITEDVRHDLLGGELKKIVIVFTDGGSDDPPRVSRALETLRKDGVVVVGVGITESGAPALTTYAPEACLAETAARLTIVLADVLKEHLASI